MCVAHLVAGACAVLPVRQAEVSQGLQGGEARQATYVGAVCGAQLKRRQACGTSSNGGRGEGEGKVMGSREKMADVR